ncbi:MAG: hydantoinase/oxoprolinase family protein [Pseudomonadales bacterium]
MKLLGVDTGGTFTDFALYADGQLRIHKVLSTPAAPEQAILQGIDELGLSEMMSGSGLLIIHGSTVATNAALERKGVRTAFVTNKGFRDLLSIGRQTRKNLYDLAPPTEQVPVEQDLCLEIDCRMDANGKIITPLTEDDLQRLRGQLLALQPKAVAINLLFSFLDDQHERAIDAVIPKAIFSCRSSEILPEYREYERGMVTWLNAWLGPIVQSYLNRLAKALPDTQITMMQSSGGTIAVQQAANRAVNLLLSGPAGGLRGALWSGKRSRLKRLLSFDMGGTSTDVALLDGDVELTIEGRLGDWPVAVPMVDMHTIGAGGGSIAQLDAGGALHVGPQSAGAQPGPAAYGCGGAQPTVTDAHVVLGQLPCSLPLAGGMQLDHDAAVHAIEPLAKSLQLSVEQAAAGIIRIANEHMTRALRLISVERGYNPADFTLCSFGGAGGLHACSLADNLTMRSALVPLNGGVLSALGMLVAPRERQLSLSKPGLLVNLDYAAIAHSFDELETAGRRQLQEEGCEEAAIQTQRTLDCRYQGQSYTLNVGFAALQKVTSDFHQAHEQRFGHRLDLPAELVTLRASLRVAASTIDVPDQKYQPSQQDDESYLPLLERNVPVIARNQLTLNQSRTGPLIVFDQTATTLVAPGWTVARDHCGNLLLQRC